MTELKLPVAMAELRPALGEIVGMGQQHARPISQPCFRPGMA